MPAYITISALAACFSASIILQRPQAAFNQSHSNCRQQICISNSRHTTTDSTNNTMLQQHNNAFRNSHPRIIIIDP